MHQTATTRHTFGLWIVCAAFFLGGCAKVNDTGLRLVSSTVDAYLIVNGQVLSGDVRLVPDRTGSVSFAAKAGAIRSCGGSLRYTSSTGGEIDLRCSDGTLVSLQTTLLGETRGYGYGSTAQGTASIAYGLPMVEAQAFLSAPSGKTLVISTQSGNFDLQ